MICNERTFCSTVRRAHDGLNCGGLKPAASQYSVSNERKAWEGKVSKSLDDNWMVFDIILDREAVYLY
jgi:hypothetical protein